MSSDIYNNPMFAGGLGDLIKGMIGNPQASAQSELLASQALLNNQTAQYRDAIGETGLAGDLASMMIRSLQAGPDYSRYAPGIGDAWLEFSGKAPRPSQAVKITGKATPKNSGELSSGGRSLIERQLRAMGITGAPAMAVLADIDADIRAGTPENAAITYGLQNLDREEIVTNPAGTVLSRMLGKDDGIPDAVELGDPTGVKPRLQGAAREQALNEARLKLKNRPDARAEIERILIQNGIDPSEL